MCVRRSGCGRAALPRGRLGGAGLQCALVREAELQRPDGAAAQAPIEVLDDDGARSVELVAPAVVLDEDVQRVARENRRARACRDLRADCVRPDRCRNVSVDSASKPMAIEGPPQDSAHDLAAPAREEMRFAHARVRNRTSCSAGTSSSRR